ncbi:MAG: hypothetical protein JW969_07165 [Spirochaetales bacterium]|nr:hypothetical protein [Spirochaetales bacterium]
MTDIIIIILLISAGFLVIYFILRNRFSRLIRKNTFIDEMKKELNKMIVEMNEVTDRNIALIEDKMTHLTNLLTKTEKKIEVLKREHERYSIVREIAERKEQESLKNMAEKEIKPSREEVIALYYQGFSAQVIASRLNMPVGEVELVIALEGEKKHE